MTHARTPEQQALHTILVVDDSPESIGLVHTALQQAGYNVLVALNGEQALSIAAQVQPDAILLDATMPVMDGFACCPRLRALLPITPIIFMTGLAESENIVRGLQSGGTDYITKPIQPSVLLARIHTHLLNARHTLEAQSALDNARQYVFSAASSTGDILWATPQARQLLQDLEERLTRHSEGNGTSHTLSSQLANWLTSDDTAHDLAIKTGDQLITIHYIKPIYEDEHLLKLVQPNAYFNTAELVHTFCLTEREAEVLLWVAHGKSNKEIADILKLSPRTINKHLEPIFKKMQVDNRTAATTLAIKALYGVDE